MDPIANLPLARIITILESIVDTGTDYEDAELRLYQNDIDITSNTLLADIDAATYTGYALHTIATWTDAFIRPDGRLVVASDQHLFQATGSAVQNTVYGWYLTSTAGAALLGGARFESPLFFAAAEDGYLVRAEVGWPVPVE